MSERIKYGFRQDADGNNHHLQLDLPYELWRPARGNAQIEESIGHLTRQHKKPVLNIREARDFTRLMFRAKSFNTSIYDKSKLMKSTTRLLEYFGSRVDATTEDPLLSVSLGQRQAGNKGAPYLTRFDMAWPQLAEDDLADMATETMLRTASNLGYKADERKKRIRAQIDRGSHGIKLITYREQQNILAPHPESYRPDAARVVLSESTLGSREEQYICLVGAVAIAHADELAVEG